MIRQRRVLVVGLSLAGLSCLLGLLVAPLLRELAPQLAVSAAYHRQPNDLLEASNSDRDRGQPDPWGQPWRIRLQGGVIRRSIYVVADRFGNIPRARFVGPYSSGPNRIDDFGGGDDLLPQPTSVIVVVAGWLGDVLLWGGGALAWLVLGGIWLRATRARALPTWFRVMTLASLPLLVAPAVLARLAPAINQLSLPFWTRPSRALGGTVIVLCVVVAACVEFSLGPPQEEISPGSAA